MQARATAKTKIQATPEIVQTINAYTKALQSCIDVAWENKISNNVKLHHVVYLTIRDRFNLPAQLAIACIKQACGLIAAAMWQKKDYAGVSDMSDFDSKVTYFQQGMISPEAKSMLKSYRIVGFA